MSLVKKQNADAAIDDFNHLLITVANNLDPDQADNMSGLI